MSPFCVSFVCLRIRPFNSVTTPDTFFVSPTTLLLTIPMRALYRQFPPVTKISTLHLLFLCLPTMDPFTRSPTPVRTTFPGLLSCDLFRPFLSLPHTDTPLPTPGTVSTSVPVHEDSRDSWNYIIRKTVTPLSYSKYKNYFSGNAVRVEVGRDWSTGVWTDGPVRRGVRPDGRRATGGTTSTGSRPVKTSGSWLTSRYGTLSFLPT